MGTLAHYLQSAFARHCPAGWTCRLEQPVLTAETEALLGYAPHVDVLLAHTDGRRRLWIEFEVSQFRFESFQQLRFTCLFNVF